jgi:hypothetical protein
MIVGAMIAGLSWDFASIRCRWYAIHASLADEVEVHDAVVDPLVNAV